MIMPLTLRRENRAAEKCLGLKESVVDRYPEAQWQRCIVHFYRNMFSHARVRFADQDPNSNTRALWRLMVENCLPCTRQVVVDCRITYRQRRSEPPPGVGQTVDYCVTESGSAPICVRCTTYCCRSRKRLGRQDCREIGHLRPENQPR